MLTPSMMVTVALTGLVITAGLLGMIELGTLHFKSAAIDGSIAFTAFALCLIVAALECRSETDSSPHDFDFRQSSDELDDPPRIHPGRARHPDGCCVGSWARPRSTPVSSPGRSRPPPPFSCCGSLASWLHGAPRQEAACAKTFLLLWPQGNRTRVCPSDTQALDVSDAL